MIYDFWQKRVLGSSIDPVEAAMLARSVFISSALLALALTTATDAEARRLKLFGSAKAAPARPASQTSPAAAPAAVAPTGRSGTFVFVAPGRGAPAAVVPASVPAEEPGRTRDAQRPMIAAVTEPETPAPARGPATPTRPAYGFEVVSAPNVGFEVVKGRN